MVTVVIAAAGSVAISPRYTVGNTGGTKPVAIGLRRYFDGRAAKLYLLGTLRGVAFYRVQPTSSYRCWAAGPASRLAVVDEVGCPDVVGPYPLQFDYTRPGVRIAGVAADGAARMALENPLGRVLASTTVVHNLFVFALPVPRTLGMLVALDARGNRLLPHPGSGYHQYLR
jgi:hypothetical protein